MTLVDVAMDLCQRAVRECRKYRADNGISKKEKLQLAFEVDEECGKAFEALFSMWPEMKTGIEGLGNCEVSITGC